MIVRGVQDEQSRKAKRTAKPGEERFVDECERQYELFEKGRLTLEDIKETLKEE